MISRFVFRGDGTRHPGHQRCSRVIGYIDPLLELSAGKKLQQLPAEQRAVIEPGVLRAVLRDQANREVELAWKRKKGPMAAY